MTVPQNREWSHVSEDGRGPLLVRPPQGADAQTWLRDSLQLIDELVIGCGGVVLRDLGLQSVSDFNRAVQVLCPEPLEYVHRSTPRTRLGGKLYTATEYPADRSIPLHNENSYTDVWPSRILFYSAVVAAEGGETPVADSRRVYQAIDSAVRERFERDGVRYVRNYTAGIDLSWQEVFQTSDRSEVERFCQAHGIDLEWPPDGPELVTRQVCRASVRHPVTSEVVWFNQAHLFHPSGLHPDEQESLIGLLGVDNLPRNALYGDGESIEPEVLEHIRDAYEQEKVVFGWQPGDVMVLDNLMFAHGRNPFRGPRKVVVAMG